MSKNINQLTQDTSPSGQSDYIPTWDTSTSQTKKATPSDLALAYNPYKFSVYLAANQTGLGDATVTKVTWDTELFDTNNNFASNKYTAPVSGFYQINVALTIQSASNTGVSSIGFLYKNSSEIRRTTIYPIFNSGQSVYLPANWSELVQLTAGDYLEVYVYMDTGSSTVTVNGGATNSSFSGFLVSRV